MNTYVFHIDQFARVGTSHKYDILTVREQGATPEEARAKVAIPEGHKIWCWWVDEKYVESK